MSDKKMIAIIGGTGREGKGLAHRLAMAGYQVTIGSREIEKAKSTAQELNTFRKYPKAVMGELNEDAVISCEIAILTVPYEHHESTLNSLRRVLSGKILIDATVPLVPPKVTTIKIPPEGSAAMQAQKILGETTTVGCAFQNVSFELLLGDEPIECEILVCCSNKEIRQEILKIVQEMGMIGRDAGELENAIIPEGLTSILIGINKKYGIHHAGIKITGIPSSNL